MRPITFQLNCEASVSLPLAFIDRYMPDCTPVYALIYIYGLRQCLAGKTGLSTREIGEVFNILETDVLNAWKFWESRGLVNMDSQGESLAIAFLPIPEEGTNVVHMPTTNTVAALKPPVFVVSERPQYTIEELTFYQTQSKDIENIFSHGEQTLGKLLTYHDLNVLFGFYDWLRLPTDVIMYLLSYCANNGHRDLRYIEKAAMDWAERGLKTTQDAQDYTATFDTEYRAVMKALGHPSAFPSPTQRKFINQNYPRRT